jgi:hypothetical protein
VKELAIGFVVIVGSFALVLGMAIGGIWWSCVDYSTTTGRPTKFSSLNCYVQDSRGVWWGWEEWKFRNATKGE